MPRSKNKDPVSEEETGSGFLINWMESLECGSWE